MCRLPTGETMQLSCAGYERRMLKAGEIAQEVALTPLHESTAITEEATAEILHKVASQMQAELKQNRKLTSEYFIRQDNELNGSSHLIEGVFSARSAVCLAKTKMQSGIHYCGEQGCQPLKYSNLHYTLSLGPVARWGDLWNNLCLPLMTKSPKSKHFRYETDYHTECHLMTSADGSQRLYRIRLIHNPRTPALRFLVWNTLGGCPEHTARMLRRRNRGTGDETTQSHRMAQQSDDSPRTHQLYQQKRAHRSGEYAHLVYMRGCHLHHIRHAGAGKGVPRKDVPQ